MKIEIRKPHQGELESRNILSWGIWECDVSTFDWTYTDRETCYLLEGEVTVETKLESVSFAAGDLVVFPAGLSCVWKVTSPVKKHFQFG
jgi:uncharacterized cupin superfamily protein